MPKAVWRGLTLAESPATREVGGYVYFPRESVRLDLLAKVPREGSDLACPHGVQFYDVVDGEAKSRRAAWSYEKPQTSMAAVDHWFGFWKDVTVD